MSEPACSERRKNRVHRDLLVPLVVLLLAVGACSTMPPPPDAVTAVGGVCNAEAVRWTIGREATAETVERARIESGSAVARVVGPDDMVTMDHRIDRLHLDVNARNAITGARCG